MSHDDASHSNDAHHNASNLNKRAFQGIKLLFGRQAATQLAGLAGGVLLARRLNPADFGVYAIITFLVSVFTLVGDLGVTASYIQREAEIETHQLQLSFTLQFALASIITLLAWIVSPWILRFYPLLRHDAVWMVRLFALTLYFPVFRSVSAVQLERHLLYAPIARAEVAEMAVYQTVAVVLAFSGFGVWSFVIATLLRGLTGTLLLYRAAPWPIRFYWDRAEMRRIIGYGVSFQMGNILNGFGNWATPTLVGMLIGPQAVGYLGNATANANRPLMIVEAVMRVSFPHFSRMQTDAAQLRNTAKAYICGFVWMASLWMTLLWAIGGPLITLVYSLKWLPSVAALKILVATLPFEVTNWTVGFCYAAVNRNWVAVRIIGLRSILMLALSAALVPWCGFTGIAWATLLSASIATWLYLAQFEAGFLWDTLRHVAWIGVCAFGGTVLGLLGARLIGGNDGAHWALQCALGGVAALGAYIGLSFLLAPPNYRNRALTALRVRLGQGPSA